jgi:hypothetical protein
MASRYYNPRRPRRCSPLERHSRQNDGPPAEREHASVEAIAPELDDADIARRVEAVRDAKRRAGRDLTDEELDRLL